MPEPVPIRPHYRTVLPHRAGWLRVSDRDHHGFEAWEKPNGDIHLHDPQAGPLLVTVRSRRGASPPDLPPPDWI